MAKKALLMSDAPPVSKQGRKTLRFFNRGRLLRALENEHIIRLIYIDQEGRLAVQCQDWDSFWFPLIRVQELRTKLSLLRSAWSAYIRASFARKLQRNYCFRYFQLLDALLAKDPRECTGESVMAALRCALGFECFGVSASGGKGPAAAATSTLRNPAYLISKLRTPRVPDSAEHLPLLSLSEAKCGNLFYHYRQHSLSRDSDNTVLSYLAVPQTIRTRSFRSVARFEQALSVRTDPFAAERATRLGRSGVLEYLRNWWEIRNCEDTLPIDLVDLGAGSGLVAARLCDEIVKDAARRGYKPRFSIRFIDLSTSRPARFFSTLKLADHVDSIQAKAMDYRNWLSRGCALPSHTGLRLVLISRFFNNLSDFTVRRFDPLAAEPARAADIATPAEECAPARCLASTGRGPKGFAASNAKIWTAAGRTVKQASLSGYFYGLGLTMGQVRPTDSGTRRANVYLPLRTFRPECLHTADGQSILSMLARQSELVVVQDADMRPSDLRMHLRNASADDLVAFDTTRLARLRGHFSYLIAKRSDPLLPKLVGERLW